jgi:VanZ family protein
MALPFRSFNVNDLLANLTGVALGITVMLVVIGQTK